MLFQAEKEGIQKKVFVERLLSYSLGAIGALSTFSLVLNPNFVPDKESKLMIQVLGLFSSVGFVATQKLSETQEKIYSTFKNAQLQDYRTDVANQMAHTSTVSKIEGARNTAYWISTLPEYEQSRWIQQFNLQGILPSENYFNQQPTEEYNPEVTIDLPKQVVNQQVKVTEEKTGFDLSWITPDFIASSKVVVGARGSGKSVFLHYEASRYLLENPNDSLFIFDPHFDDSTPKKFWLKNLPLSILVERFVTKKHQDIYKKILALSDELNNRIDNNLRPPNVPKVKIILDEEENLKRRLKDDEFENVLEFIDLIQDEGRKYGFDITIGMHSLKKGNTGIDSAALGQMNWLLFEKAAYDSATKYPSDFDQLEIKKAAKVVNSQVDRKKGRCVVVISHDFPDPIITALPYLEPPTINLESEPTDKHQADMTTEPQTETPDYLTQIKQVITSLENIPSDDEIAYLWLQISGKELDEKGLVLLKEMLGL